ncbi:MAG: hypothetical protein ACI4PR_02490 [Acutalibacteraceae bacterium]
MNNNKSFVKILNLMILTLSIFLCCGSAINQKDANAAQKLTTSEKLAGFKDDLTSEFVTKLSSIFNKIGKVFKLSLNSYYKIKDIKDYDTTQTSCWMKDLKDEASISQLVIPGSHDSSTYSMAPTTSNNLIAKAAQTQDMNVYGQLMLGARSLDLRGDEVFGKIVTNHGVVTGCEMREVLSDILKFSEENPTEVVILIFRNCSKKNLEKIANLPEIKEIGEKCLTRSMCESLNKPLGKITMGDIRNLGVKFILTGNNDGDIFHPNKDLNTKYNEPTRMADTQTMVDYELKQLDEFPEDVLRNISPVHTPSTEDFFKNKASPMKSEYKNSGIRNELLRNSEIFQKKVNIVSLDALAINEKFIKEMISMNAARGLFN